MTAHVELPTFTHPHGWTWRNDLPNPSQIHVEPAFKRELGVVFVRIDQNSARAGHRGIWLPREVMNDFVVAMYAAADAPECDDELAALMALHPLDAVWNAAVDVVTSPDFRGADGELDDVMYLRKKRRVMDAALAVITAAVDASVSGAHAVAARGAMGKDCAAHTHRELVPLEAHHIHPLGRGGPDTKANKIMLCANAHSAVHDLLLLVEGSRGWPEAPWAARRLYGWRVRRIAKQGWDAYGATWLARRAAGGHAPGGSAGGGE
jgi:hypothetical protein